MNNRPTMKQIKNPSRRPRMAAIAGGAWRTRAKSLTCVIVLAITASLFLSDPLAAQNKRERPAAPGAKPAPPTTPQIIGEAMEAVRTGDSAKAAAIFDSLQKRPDFAASRPPIALFVTVGDFHFAQGTREEQDAALQVYGLAGDIFGDNLLPNDRALLRLRRAEVMMRQGRIDPAREELAQIRRKPLSRRALVYADLGDAEILLLANQAEAAREKLAPLTESEDPAIGPMAMFHLGRAHVQLKQADQAVAIFKKLWTRYGESEMVKRAIFLVGQVYFDRGDFLEARKLYEACSVVGGTTQLRVKPGDELIVKVSDANYYSRTRSASLMATLVAPSGDKETLRLEKNTVSDQLYISRIRTTLAAPTPGDGVLQVSGGDTITITYATGSKSHKVRVVDDGIINIDGAALPEPPPRDQPARFDEEDPKPSRDARPTLSVGRQGGGALNPGSPVHIQVIDADLDASPQPDSLTVQVVAQGGGKENVVPVKLTETGPRTGVFIGSVDTASSGPTITASSEAVGHPAGSAIDVDRNSPAPTVATTRPAPPARGLTFWQAKSDDKTPFIEIDLHQSAALAKLVWGAGDDPLAGRNMPADLAIRLQGDGPEKVIQLKDQSQPSNNTVDLKGYLARTIRVEITRWKGDAPAIGQFILTDTQGNQLLPTGLDAAAAGSDDKPAVLLFNVGQTVYARYTDELNETPGTPIVRESRRLGARYQNGAMSLVKPGNLEEKNSTFHPAWRLDLDASPTLLLNDADLDLTTKPDPASVEIFTESGDSQVIELRETGPNTGVFVSPLTLSVNPDAKDNPRILHLRDGDLLWARYVDERNMQPGYRSFRYWNVLENRPSAGQWKALPFLTTAWPFEVQAAEEGAPAPTPAIVRPTGHGRLTLSIVDPDAIANAAASVPVKLNALIGSANQELTLGCTGPGVTSEAIELLLGDAQAGRIGDAGKSSSVTQLAVTGDDIVRLSYTDVRVPTADIQSRHVIDLDTSKSSARPAPKAAAPQDQPITPVIRLSDPNRREVAVQEQRLATLRDEMNARVVAYTAERKLLEERRDLLNKRQAAMPATAPAAPVPAAAPAPAAPGATTAPSAPDAPTTEADALKQSIAALSAQIDLLAARIDRLKALGATGTARPAVAKAPASDPAKDPARLEKPEKPGASGAAAINPETAPLTPGQPFDLIIDDPDLQGTTLDVRLRSVAGRLIEKLTVTAQRDPAGFFKATVPTRTGDEPEPKGSIALVYGGDLIVDYQDAAQAPLANVERVAYVAMASDATLLATKANYIDPITTVRLGEPIHLQVVDFDADRSPGIDQIAMVAKTSTGDRMVVILSETEPHSGVFRARIQTDNAAANPADDVLQASYGGAIDLTYADYLRLSPDQSEQQTLRLTVLGGTDGVVEGFSRHFKDAQEELKLWYRTGQSAYQIGRRLYQAGAYERANEYLGEATDYFSQLVARFPEDPLAASANYYVGNIQSLKGNHRDALVRYQEVVARWPKSDFVAQARFKVGQELEELGYFDQAVDAYVLLTYHHPADRHVPMAMIRMMNYYARQEQFTDATSVAQKFVEKFSKHEQAGKIAMIAGYWLSKSKKPSDAVPWLVECEKQFATSDKDMPGLLCMHAKVLLELQQGPRAGGRGAGVVARPDKIRELLSRVIYDYPRSEYVNAARKLLEEVPER